MKTNTILVGVIGSGKSSALRTIPPLSKTLLCIGTEPGLASTLGAESKGGDLHGEHCHWCSVLPATVTFDALSSQAGAVNRAPDQKSLANLPRINASEYRQFIDFLDVCKNFTCDICGKSFGPIDDLGEDYVVAIDGLTGLSQMALDLVAGGRAMRDKPHYGLAQDNLMNLIRKLFYDTKCSIVLIAHLERRVNELTGATHLTVSTVGSAINDAILKPADEVICSIRDGNKFFWSTIESGVSLKTRRLPFADNLPPDFNQLLGGPN